MKKVLWFLLFLSVSGGLVFAQSTFSWDGNARMGSRIDFVESDYTDKPIIEPWGDKKGEFGLTYVTGPLRLRTVFATNYYAMRWDDEAGDFYLAEEVLYQHPDNLFTFVMNSNILFVMGHHLNKGSYFPLWFSNGPTRMWLLCNMLDNQALRVYVGYIGRDDDDVGDGFYGDWNVSDLVKDEKFTMNPVPWRSAVQLNYTGFKNLAFGATFGGESAIAGFNIAPDSYGITDKTRFDFFRSFLWNHTVFGAKYDFSDLLKQNLRVGAMLGMETPWSASAQKYSDTMYHAYLGASYGFNEKFGKLEGLGVHADMKAVDLENDKFLYLGVGVYKWIDPAWFELNFRFRDLTENLSRVMVIEPLIAWNVLPKTLQLRLPVSVNMNFTGEEIYLSMNPGVFVNLNHDGASDDPAHGILVRYNLNYQLTNPQGVLYNNNNLEILFRVAFWN